MCVNDPDVAVMVMVEVPVGVGLGFAAADFEPPQPLTRHAIRSAEIVPPPIAMRLRKVLRFRSSGMRAKSAMGSNALAASAPGPEPLFKRETE